MPRVLAALTLAIWWSAAPGVRAEDATPDCVTSERLEILNEAVDAALAQSGLEPRIGCDTGPWRTFGSEEWPLSDMHADFIEVVAAALPEPRAGALASVALACLTLIALRRRQRA